MKITAAMSVYVCAAFALVAFWFAWTALSSLERLSDAAERDMASGYGLFWLFLGGVATAFGVLSWAIAKGKFGFADTVDE
jgi:hypothetical protein